MSLPWFAFNIAAYVKDTMRLTTEGHGAYLLLMLDYYATEHAPPDDDDVLAAICKMPVELWQAKYRKVMAPFFKIEGGFWRHERIEKEMLEAGSKLASSRARAKHAGDAYAAKIAREKLQAGSKPDPKPKKADQAVSTPASSRPEADPEPIPETTHLHLHLKKDSLSPESARDAIEEEVPHRQNLSTSEGGFVDAPNSAHENEVDDEDDESIAGTPIDPAWQLNENQIATCKFDGATPEIIEAERVAFIAKHQSQASFSQDWDASWALWWKRWKEYVAAQAEKAERRRKREEREATTAPARVEVNNVPDWESHCAFWKSTGRWPRGMGPDPDSHACKAPIDILIKHGLRKASA